MKYWCHNISCWNHFITPKFWNLMGINLHLVFMELWIHTSLFQDYIRSYIKMCYCLIHLPLVWHVSVNWISISLNNGFSPIQRHFNCTASAFVDRSFLWVCHLGLFPVSWVKVTAGLSMCQSYKYAFLGKLPILAYYLMVYWHLIPVKANKAFCVRINYRWHG